MENLKRWQRHNRMTDPGREAIHLNGLPTEIGALLPAPTSGVSRETLPLSHRIELITKSTPPATERSPHAGRSVGRHLP
jgi:hypothetical protein